MTEQFTETQQNYVDLRRVIERMRAERAAFDVQTLVGGFGRLWRHQDLERVRSEILELDPDVVVFNRGTSAYHHAMQMQYGMSDMNLM